MSIETEGLSLSCVMVELLCDEPGRGEGSDEFSRLVPGGRVPSFALCPLNVS